MEKFSLIARMPDEPGALHRAAEIIARHQGNINRIQYDHRIDPATVFFELTATRNGGKSTSRRMFDISNCRSYLTLFH